MEKKKKSRSNHVKLPHLLPDLGPTQKWANKIHIALAKHEWDRAIRLCVECKRELEVGFDNEVPVFVNDLYIMRSEIRKHLSLHGMDVVSLVLVATDAQLKGIGFSDGQIRHIDNALSEYGCCRNADLDFPPASLRQDEYYDDEGDDFDPHA